MFTASALPRRQRPLGLVRALTTLALSAACALPALAPVAAHATPQPVAASDSVDSTARWLAGLVDDEAAPVSAAQSRANDAWRDLAGLRTGPMEAFATRHFAAERSSCRTLFYPFSGPDVLNAVTLFPYCDRYVLFGLEPVGELPKLAQMSTSERTALLEEMARAQEWNVRRNFFVTNYMRKELNARHVRGVLPIMVAMLSRTGHRILDVAYTNVDGTPYVPTGAKRKPRGVTISFERTGGARQTLFYANFDASDDGLKRKPDFLTALGGQEEVVTLLKAASYLLHQPEFTTMRTLVETRSALIVQDDSGVPYQRLRDAGFQVELYGNYAKTIPSFSYRFQRDLAAAYKEQSPRPTIGFDWSYVSDRNLQSLQLARRAAPTRSATTAP
jgi:hypothetical protein